MVIVTLLCAFHFVDCNRAINLVNRIILCLHIYLDIPCVNVLCLNVTHLLRMMGLNCCPYFSGRDQLLPSREEAERLCDALPNCRIRHFKDSGHTIFLVWILFACISTLNFLMVAGCLQKCCCNKLCFIFISYPPCLLLGLGEYTSDCF